MRPAPDAECVVARRPRRSISPLLLLILTTPPMLLKILLIKSSQGPLLHADALGKNANCSRLLLRTRKYNGESLTGAEWSMPGD